MGNSTLWRRTSAGIIAPRGICLSGHRFCLKPANLTSDHSRPLASHRPSAGEIGALATSNRRSSPSITATSAWVSITRQLVSSDSQLHKFPEALEEKLYSKGVLTHKRNLVEGGPRLN